MNLSVIATRFAYLVLLAMPLWSCEEKVRIPDGPLVGAFEPGRGDSMAALERLFITTDNPHAIAQAMACERIRLGRQYGELTADTIMHILQDSIYKTRGDKKAYQRAEGAIANHVFTTNC